MNRCLAVCLSSFLLLVALSWSGPAFCGEIQDAINGGDLAKVKALLKANPDLVFSKDNFGRTPLHDSATKGNKDMAELLLANKADVNARSNEGDTPLHCAAANGCRDVAELLLANKADVNAKTSEGWTPLHNAAVNGCKDVAEVLLANKAEVDARNNDGFTPLHYAAWKSDEDIVALLLANKADVNARTHLGWTPLHCAAANGYKAAVELLLANKASVNAKTNDGWTPLDNVWGDDRNEVEDLLRQHGGHITIPEYISSAQVNEANKLAGPFFEAARAGDLAKVKALLKDDPALVFRKDSNPEEFNGGGTALHWASEKGHKDVAEFLLTKGADVNAKSNVGLTPLHLAVEEGYKDIAELLLANKADVNARSYDGNTPLHNAVARGHKDMVELLLANGANVNARNKYGSSPLHYAPGQGQKDMVKLLLAKGADVNAKDNGGNTPLHMAANSDHKDVAELLLANKADVNARNNDGYTPLHVTAYDGGGDIVDLLLANKADFHANDKVGPGFAMALDYVCKPEFGFGNMSPAELQVTYRLAGVQYEKGYVPRDIDLPKWKKLMDDKSGNTYARLCAAYFLLETDPGAQQFAAEQLDSDDLRHRYNAAQVLSMYLRGHPDSPAIISLLLKHLADGSLDGSGVMRSPDGHFADGDRDDIMDTPVTDIVGELRALKSKEAAPFLIAAVERKAPWSGQAVGALGKIGDPAAIPVLVAAVENKAPWSDFAAIALADIGDPAGIPLLLKALENNANPEVISALGSLKCKEAVPILVSHLSETSVYPTDEDQRIIEALISIGDPRAVAPLKTFLQQNHAKEDQARARRALAQLDSTDPVSALSNLYDHEPDELAQSAIISDLIRYPDNPGAVMKLSSIIETSGSAFLRRNAIYALGQIATKPALLELAGLLDKKFPSQLTAKWGWKGPPPDFTTYFPHFAAETLQEATHQDFGRDSAKWRSWIETSVKK